MNSELVSTKIPDHWLSLLIDTAHKEGVTKSSLVKKAIGQYLGFTEVDHTLVTVDLRSELDDIKTRLSAIERSTDGSTHTSTGSTNATPKPIKPTLMTATELHRALGSGYIKESKTLGKIVNKAARTRQLPPDLVALGVHADWEVKRLGNKHDNRLRWLWLERP